MADGELKGRVAVVTGGNGGIGLGMARGLAAAGATVVVAARNADKSRGAVAELTKLGAPAVAIEADVADEASVDALVARTVERFGRLDILVNNAGINIRKPVRRAGARGVAPRDRHQPHQRLPGSSRAAYPDMKRQGGGKIINIGSMMSIFGASLRARLRRQQGRHRAAHQGRWRVGVGPRQHPGQRGAARAGSTPS